MLPITQILVTISLLFGSPNTNSAPKQQSAIEQPADNGPGIWRSNT